MTIPHLLLCVGAQKSGTTWLYNRLADHPETRQASHKEMHYFTTFHNGGLLGPMIKANMMRKMVEQHPTRVARYLRAQVVEDAKVPGDVHRVFRPMNDKWYMGMFRGEGRYSMDFSPEYAELPDAGHEHVKKVSDAQKVIFIMREPLDRSLSAVRYVFKQGGRDIKSASVDEIMQAAQKPVITQLSRYDDTIATLERNYAPENLRFMFYETMMSQKAEAVNDVCDWLQMDRMDLPKSELEKRDNPTASFALPAAVIDHLQEVLTPVREAVEARFPQAREAWAGVTPG